MFQIGALPIVVLAPLGGISLLWNSLLAHAILGEGFTSMMMLGTILIATGAVLIAIYGVVPDGNHSLDELLALWHRGPFEAFFLIVCLSIVIVLVTAHVAAWRAGRADRICLPDHDDSPSNYASPRSEMAIPFRPTNTIGSFTDDSFPSPTERTVHAKMVRFASILEDGDTMPFEAEPHRILTLCGLAFAAASGTLSGICLVLAKSAVELVIATIDHWHTGRGQNEFTRVETWFLVAGLAVAAILQLVYLNYSLTFASPALICPLAFCFFNLASIFDGLVFYDQLGRLGTHQIILVSVGVAILLVGVWVVSAIQPTGGGGIEVGTWVEEEMDEESLLGEHHDELEAGEGATFLDSDEVTEPLEIDGQSPPPSPLPDGSIPSPMSPTHGRRRRPRYGTLLPELQSASRPAMPTGFAFGIGVASPGFALRSNSINHGHGHGHGAGRRNSVSSHSRSNSHSTILSSASGGGPRRRRSEEHLSGLGDEPPASGGRPRLRPLSLPAIPSGTAGMIASAPPIGGSQMEDTLAAWDNNNNQGERWRFRWPLLWRGGRGGGVKLP